MKWLLKNDFEKVRRMTADRIAAKTARLAALQQRLTLAEQYDLTHRPLIALHLALRYAETARTYAWSDKVEYTKPYNDTVRDLYERAKPEGMDVPEWVQFKVQCEGFAECLKDFHTRLHIACKQVVAEKYSDNIGLRGWALAALVALRAMRQLEERYEKVLRKKAGFRANLRDDRADTLRRAMVAFAGGDFEPQALKAYQNELTNDLLSIEFVQG